MSPVLSHSASTPHAGNSNANSQRTSQAFRLMYWLLLALMAAPAALGHYVYFSTANINQNTLFKQTLVDLRNANTDLDEVAITHTGEWIIVADGQIYVSGNFPVLPHLVIATYLSQGQSIDAIAFAEDGWVCVSEDDYYLWGTVPDHNTFVNKLEDWLDKGWQLDEVAFTRDDTGYVLISGSAANYSSDLPVDLKEAIYDRRDSKRQVNHVQFGTNGRWVVVADQWFASNGLSAQLLDKLRTCQKNQWALDTLVLAAGNSFALYGGDFTPSSPVELIEYGFDGGTSNIYEKLEDYNVPGISIAVIDNNNVTYARGYGVLENGTQRAVLSKKRFPAASLAKMVGAITFSRLIDQGYFDYDSDILDFSLPSNALGQWQAWATGAPDYFGVSGDPLPLGITVERLLSHTAGMIPSGSTANTAWPDFSPTTLNWLLGMQCTGSGCVYGNGRTVWYNPAFGPPGSEWNYSGGGFVVMEALAEVTTGNTFEQIAENELFNPLGLNYSTFDAPLSDPWIAQTTENHTDAGAVYTRRHYPWSTAGGLHTTAKDFAKMMIVLLNEGRDDKDQVFLSEAATQEIMTDRVPGSGQYGLGIALSEDVVSEASGFFGHSGSQIGAVTAMIGFPSLDRGFVSMVNSNDGNGLAAEIRGVYQCVYALPTCP